MNKKVCIVLVSAGVPLAIAVASFLAWRLFAGQENAETEQMIRNLGGRVERDPQELKGPIISVNLFKTRVTDTELRELADLRSLQELVLSDTNITGLLQTERTADVSCKFCIL